MLKPCRLDELPGDACAHPVELARAVGCLAEQHHASSGHSLQQRIEVARFDVVEALDRLPHQPREGTVRAGWVAGLPAALANERDETDFPQVLADQRAVGQAANADQLCISAGPTGMTSSRPV